MIKDLDEHSDWSYVQKTKKQLKNWFNAKERENKSEFIDFNQFEDWYNTQLKQCNYCNLTEEESQNIIHTGLLISNRFPQYGIIKRGVNRGYWLEIDRKNPKGLYSVDNIVLCCYFCNNDKSDVFTDTEYSEFIKDRRGYLRKIIKNSSE